MIKRNQALEASELENDVPLLKTHQKHTHQNPVIYGDRRTGEENALYRYSETLFRHCEALQIRARGELH